MDAPGPYVVVHKSLVVTSGAARISGVIARLSNGDLLDVLEVDAQDGGQKIRGRIREPAGWVTIFDGERGIRGAAPSGGASVGGGAPSATDQVASFATAAAIAVASLATASAAPRSPSPPRAPAPAAVAAPPSPGQAHSSAASRGAAERAARAAATARAAERLRRLELEIHQVEFRIEDRQAELEATRTRCKELQSRWADASGTSDEALQAADEARRQAVQLRRAIEEKGDRLASLQQELVQIAAEKESVEREHAELEVVFRKRLASQFGDQEQRLLQEKALLKRMGEEAERRVHDLAGEKAFLEQRVMACGTSTSSTSTGGGDGKHEAMLEAHMSIAHAFGLISMEHPCLRLGDEPMLKLTVLLLKQPLVRRVFFGFTLSVWVIAVRTLLLTQSSGPPIHV